MSTPPPALPPVCVGRTDFPLRPDPSARGPLALPRPPSAPHAPPSFRLLDGPPYANGPVHLGHVLNKHLKDAVCRAQSLQGACVEWRPGWDCHGLPLELAVERAGVPRADPARFLPAARTFAASQVALQAQAFAGQGLAADFAHPWTTMDPAFQAATMRVLARLLDAQALDVRLAPVPWCPQCRSTVAGAEAVERALDTVAWVVPFTLESSGPVPEVLLAYTSTPWTLPLNQALAVDPVAPFVALELPGAPRAWVSATTAPRWAAELGATVSQATCVGADLAGRAYRTPWSVGTVLADTAAEPAAGTGVLHAVHGLAVPDTHLAHRHGLPPVQHLTEDGRVQDTPCPAQEGLPAGPASNAVLEPFFAPNPWFARLPQSAAHPHCWRHGVPLLTRASRQVFLHLDEATRARAAAMVDAMAFTPAAARSRLVSAMASRPDWCLSRQRTWGVPLALFLDPATGQPHARAAHWMRRVADAVETRGVEAWWDTPTQHWLGTDAQACDLVRVDDVLDVWFDSGCLPQHLGVADTVGEGVDQHRGWFQACVWVAAALDAPAPFARVVSHGFVVDGAGAKVSKSSGGDRPSSGLPAWQDLPTDVVRAWALAGSEGADKGYTQETLRQAQAVSARLRGLLRFCLANALPTTTRLSPDQLRDLPAWDLVWAARTRAMARRVLELAGTGFTGQALDQASRFAEEFSAVCLGAWKDRLYCAPAHAFERQALDVVLKDCLEAWASVLAVLAPRALDEARPHFPPPSPSQSLPPPTPQQCAQVAAVLATRASLAPLAERWVQKKVPPARHGVRAQGLPPWPGQLLADALGVAQVDPAPADAKGLCLVQPGVGVVEVFELTCPVCPRCRRAQPSLEQGACAPCAQRPG